MKRLLIGMALLAAGSCGARGEAPSLPRYRNYVNDYAGVLGAAAEAELNDLLAGLDRATTAQVAVATVDTTAPDTIERYAVRLFEEWGIGQKGKDNGVLLLAAMKDRKARIEVGYGIEGAIPDARADGIMRSVLLPQFRQGAFERGIVEAARALAGLAAAEYGVELPGAAPAARVPGGGPSPFAARLLRVLLPLLVFIAMLGLRLGLFGWLLLGPGRRRRGGFWYGSGAGGSRGGFSGGFGGFGGGMSGGGGASGGW